MVVQVREATGAITTTTCDLLPFFLPFYCEVEEGFQNKAN